MERRLAISQKRSHSKFDNFDTEPPPQQQEQQQPNTFTCATSQGLAPKLRSHLDIINSDRQPRSRSSSNDRGTRTSRQAYSQSETPVSQDVQPSSEPQQTVNVGISASSAKRCSKRRTQNEVPPFENTAKKRKTKQGEIRTRVEYVGLDLPVSRTKKLNLMQQIQPLNSDSNNIPNHFDVVGNNADLANCSSLSSSSCNVSVQGSDGGRSVLNGSEEAIIVPSWRTCIVKTSNELLGSDEIEVRRETNGSCTCVIL